ncbi:hypothetical protein [Kitasatospora sp. NPDC058190]|uniref:hypothetical protein n=1 Tax=Kitasatospora sp. NPDC058190 TaxID=3346371 RepID=UPI0036DA38FB
MNELFSAGWAAATYLALPAMMIDGLGVAEGTRRSAGMLRETFSRRDWFGGQAGAGIRAPRPSKSRVMERQSVASVPAPSAPGAMELPDGLKAREVEVTGADRHRAGR